MSGRPVHLLAAAAIAAAASFVSISDASAGCYGCGGGYTYQAPVAYYTAPVVYSYSYAAPAAYASGCGCGGYATSGYARPMYTVNQGPAYTAPVVEAEPTPEVDYSYGYRRAPRFYGGYGYRMHRHWGHRGGYGRNYGYGHRHGYGHRFGMKRFRYGAVVPGRHAMRHMHQMGLRRPHHMGGMHRHMGGAISPRHWGNVMHRGGGMKPGTVHSKKP